MQRRWSAAGLVGSHPEGSAEVEITALSHAVPSDWVDSQGEQLSDHEPLVADFGVTFVPEPCATTLSAAAVGALAALARRRRRPRSAPGALQVAAP